MPRPNWEYIRIDVLLPDHPKLDGLTPSARSMLIGVLVELWCKCGQHLTDGKISEARWTAHGTPRIRAQLIERGFAERVDGGYLMHDFTDHNRTREQAKELTRKRTEAGRRGGKAKANAVASARASAKQEPEQVPEPLLSKLPIYAEAEAEEVQVDVGDQSSRRNARTPGVIDLIISEIHAVTGRQISRQWAEGIRAGLLNGRQVNDPASYVVAAIRGERDPRARFLPVAASAPSARPASEVLASANGRQPARGDTVHDYAAQARAAINREQEPA